MTNLSTLDKTIQQIESHAEELKQHTGVLAKVKELSTIIETSARELNEGNKGLETVKESVIDTLGKLNKQVIELQKQNEEHIESLISSNRKFQREVKESISSKIERFSSDIQVTIRQERTQMQDSIQNNITLMFNSLEAKQKELFEKQSKRFSTLFYLGMGCLLVGLGILVKVFLK